MEKSIACILFFLTLFFVVSCADGNSVAFTGSGGRTLRSEADENDRNILWTRELESMRLVQNIAVRDGIDKAVKLTPQTIPASGTVPAAVYPFIDGFGSLDTSLIPQELRTALDTVCRTISSRENADQLMASGCLYSYVLFLEDFTAGWKETFGEPVPDKQNSTDLFSEEIYGAPFINDDYEIPVRFKCAKGYADILFCFIKNDSGYKLTQIEIEKWGRADGK